MFYTFIFFFIPHIRSSIQYLSLSVKWTDSIILSRSIHKGNTLFKVISIIVQRASLVAQTVKNLPAVQEIQVQSLGRKDPLEKGMAIRSNILAWRIPWTEEPGTVHGVAESWT